MTTHRAHGATSSGYCVAYVNPVPSLPAGDDLSFTREKVDCWFCLATYGEAVVVACDDTRGVHQPRTAFYIDRKTKLGCGCTRLEGNRPGPQDSDDIGRMHALTGCSFHPSDVLALWQDAD